MKILFVNLCVRPDTNKKIPNVGLAYVMGAIDRAGYEFSLIDIDLHRYSDVELERLVKGSNFDVVAFGALVSLYRQVREISKLIRKYHPDVKIVLGNTLATAATDIVLQRTDVDICIIGEGEETFVELMGTLEQGADLNTVANICFVLNGQIIKTEKRPVIRDLDAIPLLDFELFDIEGYLANSKYHVAAPEKLPYKFDELRALPINTARGCAFSCTFCSHAFKGSHYRVRTPANIVAEIKQRQEQYGINFVNFWDELTFPTMKAAEEFSDLIIEAGMEIYWIASVRSELLKGERGLEAAQKMARAGCHGLAFSLESGNPEILKAMKKRNSVADFLCQCEILKKAGIDIYTSIVVGFPQETAETLDETFDVLERAGVYPSVGFLQVLPGTPLYDDIVERGLIDEEDYLLSMGDRQDLRINLTACDDEFLIDYTSQKLVALNRKLKMGLDENALIKTRVWRGSGKEKQDELQEGSESSAKILRDSNFT